MWHLGRPGSADLGLRCGPNVFASERFCSDGTCEELWPLLHENLRTIHKDGVPSYSNSKLSFLLDAAFSGLMSEQCGSTEVPPELGMGSGFIPSHFCSGSLSGPAIRVAELGFEHGPLLRED